MIYNDTELSSKCVAELSLKLMMPVAAEPHRLHRTSDLFRIRLTDLPRACHTSADLSYVPNVTPEFRLRSTYSSLHHDRRPSPGRQRKVPALPFLIVTKQILPRKAHRSYP
jgi:hypothetical protein